MISLDWCVRNKVLLFIYSIVIKMQENYLYISMKMIISKIIRDIPPRYMKLNEKDITSYFGKLVRDAGWFFYKISDNSQDLKPFDAICFAKDTPYEIEGCIEFKAINNSQKVDVVKLLRPNQIQGMILARVSGWSAYVGLYIKPKNLLCFVDIKEVLDKRILDIRNLQ